MIGKLKRGCSYLVNTDSSPVAVKMIVLDATNTLYHIRWGITGIEEWHPHHKFSQSGSTYNVLEQIDDAAAIEPEEYRAVIRDLTDRLSDAAMFYERLEKKNFNITDADIKSLFKEAKSFRDSIDKALEFIGEKTKEEA